MRPEGWVILSPKPIHPGTGGLYAARCFQVYLTLNTNVEDMFWERFVEWSSHTYRRKRQRQELSHLRVFRANCDSSDSSDISDTSDASDTSDTSDSRVLAENLVGLGFLKSVS